MARTATLACWLVLVPVSLWAEPVPSKLQVDLVIPAGVASFEGLQLELQLWEYDPLLADAKAMLFDEQKVKNFLHTKGKETRMSYTLGEKANGGKTNDRRRYYLTVFLTQDAKRTHIGEKDGKPGLCNVLTDGNPNKVTMVVREVKN
jgi:hypothetical protein